MGHCVIWQIVANIYISCVLAVRQSHLTLKMKVPLSYEVLGTACPTLQCHLPENLCLAKVERETQISHVVVFMWIYLKCLCGYIWNM